MNDFKYANHFLKNLSTYKTDQLKTKWFLKHDVDTYH